MLPQTNFNYGAEYDGDRVVLNSAVGAAVNWMARTFPEASLGARRFDPGQDLMVPSFDHPVIALLNRPNPHFSGRLLRMAIATDFIVNGNAYLLKIRSVDGSVVQLWWAPASTLSPNSPKGSSYENNYQVGSDQEFIASYTYAVGSTTVNIPVEDVIHMRFGIDPDNTRLGRSPLASTLREIFTDDEAANFTASVLRNFGIPGVILAPGEGVGAVNDQELAEIRDRWADQFSGDNRGRLMIMRGKTDVKTLSWSPQQLNLRELRRIPEERISAVLGVPAIVAGLGAGLDRSTFANMSEAREMAWESGLIPVQALIADDLTAQLLPDFDDDPTAQIYFDYTDVRVLQDDATNLARRWRELVHGSIAKRSEARAALGLPVEEADNVYLQPLNVIEVGDGAPSPEEKYEAVVESNGELEESAQLQEALRRVGPEEKHNTTLDPLGY
jgi:HK97 family phage portal protein